MDHSSNENVLGLDKTKKKLRRTYTCTSADDTEGEYVYLFCFIDDA
jgi:hypothetical protein